MIERLEEELEMFERHMTVLQLVVEKNPIGIVAMSNETGIPHHQVRYSLRVLEEERLIEPTKNGAVPTDETKGFLERHGDGIDEIIERVENMRVSQGISA